MSQREIETELASRNLHFTENAIFELDKIEAWRVVIDIIEQEYADAGLITQVTVQDAHEQIDDYVESDESDELDTEIEPKLMTYDGYEFDDDATPFDMVSPDNRPDSVPRNNDDDLTVNITKDITGESTGQPDAEHFRKVFLNRFERLHDKLSNYVNPTEIKRLKSKSQHGEVEESAVIGLVKKKKYSQNGDPMFILEDDTDSMHIWMDGDEFQDVFDETVHDEMIAVEGGVSDDGGLMFADAVYTPDIEPMNTASTASNTSAKVAVVSDIHLASENFDYSRWNAFVDWIRENPDIKYILCVGDLVEGIGVYPGQEEELEVADIDEQYELCAKAFEQLPDDVEIISITGNHDDARLDEPQPSIDERHGEKFGENVTLVGNPANITIEGVSFLLYHGMSLQTISELIPSAKLDKPTTCMKPLLKKRHLMPPHEHRPRQAPEERDYLVIEDTPDVFLTGHIHMLGFGTYNEVRMGCCSTFQQQTGFQKSKNIQPDVGYVTVFDLDTLNSDILSF